MGAYGSNGITIGCAVLYLHTLHGIGIITSPGLGCVIHDPRIEPGAAAGAGFKEKLREIGDLAIRAKGAYEI